MSPYRAGGAARSPSGSVFTVFFPVFCYFLSQGSFAVNLIKSDVTYDNGTYSINVAMDIDGDIARTREILPDYGQTPRYNDNIIRSELLKTTTSGKKIGRVEIRDCLLFICRTLVQIQEMEKLSSGDIRIHVIPERSDYRTGDYLWHLTTGPDGVTKLRVAEIQTTAVFPGIRPV